MSGDINASTLETIALNVASFFNGKRLFTCIESNLNNTCWVVVRTHTSHQFYLNGVSFVSTKCHRYVQLDNNKNKVHVNTKASLTFCIIGIGQNLVTYPLQ